MICEECEKMFPKDQKAYINGKIVCQRCFTRLKIGKRNKGSVIRSYLDWVISK